MSMNNRNARPVVSEPEDLEGQPEAPREEEANSEASTQREGLEHEETEAARKKSLEDAKEVTRVINAINSVVKQLPAERRAVYLFSGNDAENLNTWAMKLTKKIRKQFVPVELWGEILSSFVGGRAETLLDADLEELGREDWTFSLLMKALRGHYDTPAIRQANREKLKGLKLADYANLDNFLEAWWLLQARHGVQGDMPIDDQIGHLCNSLTIELKYEVLGKLPVYTRDCTFQDLHKAVAQVKKSHNELLQKETEINKNNSLSFSLSPWTW